MFARYLTVIGRWLRPHRTIPHLPWMAKGRWKPTFGSLLILILGLSLFGVGEALLVQSGLGNSPWTVLAQGFSLHTGINLGWATFLISCVVLLLWIPLKERPGFGTVMNIVVIAFALQVGVDFIPLQTSFIPQLLLVLAGVLCVGIASALYISSGLGPGPRDGLMTGLHKKTGVRIGRVRLTIEATVLILGAFLGGRIGLGTALFALLIGQSIAISFGFLARLTHK
jgi:uncharacterized membrane protein YczE